MPLDIPSLPSHPELGHAQHQYPELSAKYERRMFLEDNGIQLTSRQAQVVIDGAEAKARELGLPVVIAVVDVGAHLKAFRRMDGAVLASIDIAIRKASTAVLFEANSEAVWEYCKPGAPAHGLELTNGGLAPFGGGIPPRDRTVLSSAPWACPAALCRKTSKLRRQPSRPLKP